MQQSVSFWDHPALWLIFYFTANLGLTLHNKFVLATLDFHYPWLLTALHIFMSGVGAWITHHFLQLPRHIPTRKESISLALFSLLYTINIALSNVSMDWVSLAFHQIVRSSTPVWTVGLERVMGGKRVKWTVLMSLMPVMLGVILATMGESQTQKSKNQEVEESHDFIYTIIGIFLTVLGVLLSALKGIVTHRFMVGSLQLHPLDLLLQMAPLAFLQCLFYATLFGEVHSLRWSLTDPNSPLSRDLLGLSLKLFFNGLLAFYLNVVSFTANKKTSALSMTVAGNVKQAFSIVLAFYVFQTPITVWGAWGTLVTVLGGAWYSFVSWKEKNANNNTVTPSTTVTVTQGGPPKSPAKTMNHQDLEKGKIVD